MGEHEEPALARELVDLGRAMDRQPSARTVATIVARAVEQAPPRRPRAKILLAAASVAAVLALSVHAESLLRDTAADVTTSAETGIGDCSAWASMDVVPLAKLNLDTGWDPPSSVGMWSAQQYFTRNTASTNIAAMVHYTRGADMVSLERYPPHMRIDLKPANVGEVAETHVGAYAGQWARARLGGYYRVTTVLQGSDGQEGDRIAVICDGSRLTWTDRDGSSYSLSGSVSEEALLAMAESLP
ncbi:hypothetical protein [Actinokineospora diospyrosa]|uniref:Uncharacterized protein n=1 Tax=Actinokineospora diospyrosa TaxID=103728 RepID=A0ABT1IFT8_9PSEU|nr:hypothetical protein [Actinokineospora diospyrosa]MCP2271416.1 hypothetical protein [Actinokineospora diospyrosa]